MRSEDWYAAVEERLAAVEAKLAPAAAVCPIDGPGCTVEHGPPSARCQYPGCQMPEFPSSVVHDERMPGFHPWSPKPVMTVDHVRAISEYMRNHIGPYAGGAWEPRDPFGVEELKGQNTALQRKVERMGDEVQVLRAALGPGWIWHLVPEFPLSNTKSGWEPCLHQSECGDWSHEWRKEQPA